MFMRKIIIGMAVLFLAQSDYAAELLVPSQYSTIQAAINAASTGDTVIVSEGTYYECVDFNNVACTVRSTNPNDWDVVSATVIDANDETAVIFDSGEDSTSVLKGLTIRNEGGAGVKCDCSSPVITKCIIEESSSYGVHCIYGASPTIKNNIIRDNNINGILFNGPTTAPTIINNLIYNNAYGIYFLYVSSSTIIRNNTIVGNTTRGISRTGLPVVPTISNCILWDNGDDLHNCSATYSCIEESFDVNDPNFIGSISSDPCFVDADANDFRLSENSPCIDAGDPCFSDAGETDIDGLCRVIDGDDNCNNRVDIGACEFVLVQVTHIKFNHTIEDDISDGIDLKEMDGNYPDYDVVDIYAPEWENGVKNKPAAYVMNTDATIQARFTISDSNVTSATIWATSSDGNLGNIEERTVIFSNGVSYDPTSDDANYVSFELASSTPDAIEKGIVTWEWKIRDIDDCNSPEYSFGSSGPHTVYIVVDTPQAPQAKPWIETLDIACDAAYSANTKHLAMWHIWDEFYQDAGAAYDTYAGESHYDGLYLGQWLNNYGNISFVNCQDMAYAQVVFANSLGCNSESYWVHDFGYLNCCKPVGCDWTNNPCYDNNDVFSTDLIVPGDWAYDSNDPCHSRCRFWGHEFAALEGKIFDSCIGKVDLGNEGGWDPDDPCDPDRPDYGLTGEPNTTFNAYDLEGNNIWWADSHVLVPEGISLRISGAITIGAWIKLDVNANNPTIVERVKSPSEYGYRLAFSDGTGLSDGTFRLVFQKDGGSGNYGTDTSWDRVVSNKNDWGTNEWYFVAGTWDGTTDSNSLKMYVDGELDASHTASQGMIAFDTDLRIGGSLDGKIDDVRIYNEALSAEDINDIYEGDSISSNPVAHWEFDEGEDDTASDSSVNSNHGTIYGATWIDGQIGYHALDFNDFDEYRDIVIDNEPYITSGNPSGGYVPGVQ